MVILQPTANDMRILSVKKNVHFGQTYDKHQMLIGSIKSVKENDTNKFIRVEGELTYITAFPTHQESNFGNGIWKKIYKYTWILQWNPDTEDFKNYRPITNKMERDTFGNPIEYAKNLIKEATKTYLD